MCGICGIVSFKSPIDIEVVKRMNDALYHRGPDGFGYSHFPNCSLGHRRLAIIDLVSGHQPMADKEDAPSYTIVYNGEVYNYKEIRDKLKQMGHGFRTNSDTEVVLASYIAYGPECLRILNGMFAVAIWNEAKEELFLARDRFGQKPLYYAFTEKGDLLFASEIKAILASGLIKGKLDYRAVDNYLTLLYVPPYRTIFKNIHVLEPASYLIYNQGGMEKKEKYWRLDYKEIKIKEEEACEEIRRLLKNAVKRHLVSDVPIGSFLSGGVDSSIVSYLMKETSEEKIKTFSVGFGNYINELPYAKEVSVLCASDHHEMQMDIDVPVLLLEMAKCYDEPFADSSNIPTFLISKYAKQNVKVILTGDGGDETFGGYGWYFNLDKVVEKRGIKKWAKSLVFREKLKNQYYFTHVGRMKYLSPQEKQAIWRTSQFIDDEYVYYYFPNDSVRGLNEAFFFDINCYLPGDILAKVDRSSMWASLESRAPFLDHELAEFTFSLPCSYKVQGGTGKSILKKAFQGIIPDSILYRSKQGFGAPVGHWLRQPAVRNMTIRYLKSPDAKVGKFFSMESVARLIDGFFERDKGGSGYKLWALLVLEMWLEQWSHYIDFVDD